MHFFPDLPVYSLFGIAVVAAIVVVKIYLTAIKGVCKSTNKITGKTVIITGANTGIGKETAIDLARRGGRIILACRDLKKASAARDEIISISGNENVFVKELNLASLESVRKFAKDIIKSESRLDILINNAGCAGLDKQLTEDGLELQMQSNHFGHFLLTNLLLGLMVRSNGDGRIINVSSEAHNFYNRLDVDDLNFERDTSAGALWAPMRIYSAAKLCNILFTKELAGKLKHFGLLKKSNPSRIINVSSVSHKFAVSLDLSNLNGETFYNCHNAYHKSKLCQILATRHLSALLIGSGVTINALEPGVVSTEIFRAVPWLDFTMNQICGPFIKTAKEGAQTTIYLAVADEVANTTGEYFRDCKVVQPSKLACDAGLAKKLWEASEEQVKLHPTERHF